MRKFVSKTKIYSFFMWFCFTCFCTAVTLKKGQVMLPVWSQQKHWSDWFNFVLCALVCCGITILHRVQLTIFLVSLKLKRLEFMERQADFMYSLSLLFFPLWNPNFYLSFLSSEPIRCYSQLNLVRLWLPTCCKGSQSKEGRMVAVGLVRQGVHQ